MIVDTVEDVSEIGQRIKVVEFGCLDDGHGAGQGFRAGVRAREEPVFSSYPSWLVIVHALRKCLETLISGLQAQRDTGVLSLQERF